MAEQLEVKPACKSCKFWMTYSVPGRGRCSVWDQITHSFENCARFESRDESQKGGA